MRTPTDRKIQPYALLYKITNIKNGSCSHRTIGSTKAHRRKRIVPCGGLYVLCFFVIFITEDHRIVKHIHQYGMLAIDVARQYLFT